MADATTTQAPATTPNATVFTFEEQATASVALYSMSIFCIVVGGIRSAQYISTQIKKRRLIEGSVTLREAKKFPISASFVLFSLYIFFKPAHERFNWVAAVLQKIRVPDEYVQKVNATIIAYTANSTSTDPAVPFYERLIAKLPFSVQEYAVIPECLLGYVNWVSEKIPDLGKDEAMIVITFLICFEGLTALANLVKPFVTCFLKKFPLIPSFFRFNTPYLFSLKKGLKEMEEGDISEASKKDVDYLFKMEIDCHDIIALIICSPVLISHLTKRHWITNNLIGIAFSILGIERLHLSSFKAGALLLAGLFIYDVFWVFATDVMTSVAKGIDAPILLQFPQDIYRKGPWEANKYSMLGLGDIVIPGIFLALLKRFDQRIVETTVEAKSQKKPARFYFSITCVAYALGLFITMLVMHHFKAAQPALLYLVPCCLIVPLIVATFRGELSYLWNYDEGMYVKDETKKVDSAKKNN
ncbi:unnamed protein product [Caenorhabditis bovis]|uniref:Uncharacterized protein n=1 Tax=Caenorhabditis bovis TaxID=2654633 RepID=A0A8S1FA81_9PELO|nr:unnamed protein product [Caenorhabditis bovis]